ncbi:MAG: conjugal transfer protein TraX [Oscillospiraceae bacterium]|jgi:hypothetical protein|nr:conjugal transfer protein TraX [Oscillospiraceae bacterium]
MTSFALRIVAMLLMVIDHAGYLLFDNNTVMRMIGRLSFPIFCFLIAEGLSHTKSLKKYLLRLALFAAVSEIPYDLVFHKTAFYQESSNVFFTLLLGLAAAAVIKKSEKLHIALRALLGAAAVVLCSFAAEWICCDYKSYGVLAIVLFYLFRENRVLALASFSALTLYRYGVKDMSTQIFEQFYASGALKETVLFVLLKGAKTTYYFGTAIQSLAVLSSAIIALYNKERGSKRLKWAFYLFYPAHLMVLWGIYLML